MPVIYGSNRLHRGLVVPEDGRAIFAGGGRGNGETPRPPQTEHTMTAEFTTTGGGSTGYSNFGTVIGSIDPVKTYDNHDISRVMHTGPDTYFRLSLGTAGLAQDYLTSVSVGGITDPAWAGGPIKFFMASADLYLSDETGNTSWLWLFATPFVDTHQYSVTIAE